MRASSGPAIDVTGLRKRYAGGLRRRRPQQALDGLDLCVDSGGRVHGFLGPNGSGKTTTLRTLLGLVRADGGSVRLLGRPVPGDLADVIGAVGALVEAPQFFGNFSGRRNLGYLGAVAGVPAARVDEVLTQVDLADRADDPVRGYSLGMRQRLAIAAAMLKRPQLLLLDEPSNGLDPAGIRDVRALLRRLADDGTTVLLSSHLLAEVQQVCDEVTIVAKGRTVATGPVDQVLAAADGHQRRVRIAVKDPAAATAILSGAGLSVERAGDRLHVTGPMEPGAINQLLAEHGIYASELATDGVDLEEAFLLLTGGLQGDPPADVERPR